METFSCGVDLPKYHFLYHFLGKMDIPPIYYHIHVISKA